MLAELTDKPPQGNQSTHGDVVGEPSPILDLLTPHVSSELLIPSGFANIWLLVIKRNFPTLSEVGKESEITRMAFTFLDFIFSFSPNSWIHRFFVI